MQPFRLKEKLPVKRNLGKTLQPPRLTPKRTTDAYLVRTTTLIFRYYDQLRPIGRSFRRNQSFSFRRWLTDGSGRTDGPGLVIVGLPGRYEIVNAASASNEVCIDLLERFTWNATVYVIAFDCIGGGITRRDTCVPRESHSVRLG